jgi:hypothetical protein
MVSNREIDLLARKIISDLRRRELNAQEAERQKYEKALRRQRKKAA